MSKTANRSFLLAASKIIVIFLNAILLMMLSRYFSTTDYGIYKDIVLKETVLSIIGEMGLSSAAIYFLNGKRRGEYLSGILNISLILVLVSIPFSLYFSPVSGIAKLVFSVMVILKLLTITSTNMMIAVGKNRFLLAYTLLPPLFTVLLVLLLGFASGTIYILLIILLVRRIIELSISFVFWLRTGNPFHRASKDILKEILRFSLPLAISSVVGVLNMNIDKLIVKSFFSLEEFAVFTNGAYELPVLQIFSGSLFTVMIPKLKRLKDENKIPEVVRNWKQLGEITATIVIPLTVVLIFFSESFILFMFSDKYIGSVEIFRIYQIKNLFRIYLYGSIFIAFAENRKLMINTVISLILNTILNLVFIHLFGLPGVAYATVISLFVLVFLQCYQISRFLEIKIYQAYPLVKWAAMIVTSLPLTFLAHRITETYQLSFQITAMIAVTGVNFIIVSLLFNRTILDFIMEKLKGLFKYN